MTYARVTGIAVGIIIAGLAVAWLASPFLAVHALDGALRDGQLGKVEALVDFRAIQNSLKPQVQAALTGTPHSSPAVTDGVIEMVTDLGALSLIMAGQDPLPEALAALSSPDLPFIWREPHDSKAHHKRFYQSLNRFRADVFSPDDPIIPRASLTFERRNLVQWKLTGIALPHCCQGQ